MLRVADEMRRGTCTGSFLPPRRAAPETAMSPGCSYPYRPRPITRIYTSRIGAPYMPNRRRFHHVAGPKSFRCDTCAIPAHPVAAKQESADVRRQRFPVPRRETVRNPCCSYSAAGAPAASSSESVPFSASPLSRRKSVIPAPTRILYHATTFFISDTCTRSRS